MITRPHVIDSLRTFLFSTLESGFKNARLRCRTRRMRMDGPGSRIQKEKVADSKISGNSLRRGLKLDRNTVHVF